MSSIHLSGTPKTPEVQFSIDPMEMSISGRSIPENSIEFYRPLMEWVDSHIADSEASVDFSIRLEYFNTSSSKCLMDLLKRIEKSPIEATILWYYEEEDEDMLEAGEDYSAIVNIPFKLIAVAGS
ncbi:MAG: DUF1987 domain-containing protein [Flavobacteriales bacterium]|nr:DUF1987 domain-containing protein [Flavobacteriales bacterium]